MALKTVADLKYSVAGILSGIDLNNVDDVYGCFERAAATLVQKADVPECMGTQNLILYSGVTDYLADEEIFATSINDIRPQGISRPISNFVFKKSQLDFDRIKNVYNNSDTCATFQYSNGIPIIRILSPFTKQAIILDTMTDITGWTYNASVNDLIQDISFYYQQPASMRFNLQAGGSAGYLEKTLTSPINLNSYQGTGVAFMAVEYSSANITSFELRIGSDSSNYYSISNTTGFTGNILNEFFLVAFDLSLATTVGSPDITKIKYIRTTYNYDGTAMTNVRMGRLFISLPSPAQIIYQTAAIFLTPGQTQANSEIVGDTDEIVLQDPAYNIFLYECALAVLENTGATASDATSQKIMMKLHGNGNTDRGLYTMFEGDNPSQEIRMTGSWYENDLGYGGGYSGNW